MISPFNAHTRFALAPALADRWHVGVKAAHVMPDVQAPREAVRVRRPDAGRGATMRRWSPQRRTPRTPYPLTLAPPTSPRS
jgi:hypothetical protein